jgi:hypothetical protein
VRELRNAADRFALDLDLELGRSLLTSRCTGSGLAEQVAAHEKT